MLQAPELKDAFLLSEGTRAQVVSCVKALLDEACDELLDELGKRCSGSVAQMAECLASGVLKVGGEEQTELSFADIIRRRLRACGKGGRSWLELELEQALQLAEGPAAELLRFVSGQLDRVLSSIQRRHPEAYQQLKDRKDCVIKSREVRHSLHGC